MAIEEINPARPMPVDTPLLKVSRPVAACSRCRNAKIRCDGKLPACSSCEKNGRAAECTSTNDQFARGKERSYVSTLETRIDRLLTKLEEAKMRKPSVVSLPDDDQVASSRRPSYQVEDPPTPTTSRAQRRREASAIDDLVSDFGFLSVNATARDFYGFTSAMSYARLIISACSKDTLPPAGVNALPPRYAATALIQYYFDNVFVLLPLFDEASFYNSVDRVYSTGTRVRPEPFDYWLLHMVLAIASASMSEQRGDKHYMEGISHLCAALQEAERVLHPGSISSVQALVLLTEYAMLDPHHFDSWSLIGAASRAMVDLGLHQDPPKGASMSKGKLELRRKVFHCIYTLDRSTSLVQTRSFSFSDDSAKVKVPFHKMPVSAPTSPQGASQPQTWLHSHDQALALVTLRQLQSVWYTDLFQSGRSRWEEPYPYIWDTCDTMRRWFDPISTSANPNTVAFFELELLYSYVYVLSPSPRVPAIHPFAQRLIFEYCIRYSDLVLRLIKDPSYTAPLTFYDAMRVYMTGRQFLDVLVHNTNEILNGIIPPLPVVKPTTAPPPQLPVVHRPPEQAVQHFNIERSIKCIGQITECLARFGVRWGYMSWKQRYQKETAHMLEGLNQRMSELDEMAGMHRSSQWPQHDPSGSGVSSNGSIAYGSLQGNVLGSMNFQPPSVSATQVPGYVEPAPAPHISSSLFHQQMFPQVYEDSQQPPQQYQQPPYHLQQSSGQPLDFQEIFPAQQPPTHSVAPIDQFNDWAGYDGHPLQLDPLDAENAMLEKTLDAALAQAGESSFGEGPEHQPLIQNPLGNPITEHGGNGLQRQRYNNPSDEHADRFSQAGTRTRTGSTALDTAVRELPQTPPFETWLDPSLRPADHASSGHVGTGIEMGLLSPVQRRELEDLQQSVREAAAPEPSSESESSGVEMPARDPKSRRATITQASMRQQQKHRRKESAASSSSASAPRRAPADAENVRPALTLTQASQFSGAPDPSDLPLVTDTGYSSPHIPKTSANEVPTHPRDEGSAWDNPRDKRPAWDNARDKRATWDHPRHERSVSMQDAITDLCLSPFSPAIRENVQRTRVLRSQRMRRRNAASEAGSSRTPSPSDPTAAILNDPNVYYGVEPDDANDAPNPSWVCRTCFQVVHPRLHSTDRHVCMNLHELLAHRRRVTPALSRDEQSVALERVRQEKLAGRPIRRDWALGPHDRTQTAPGTRDPQSSARQPDLGPTENTQS